MCFKQISQIVEFLANLFTVFGVSLISVVSYFYKTRIYNIENYKLIKDSDNIPKGELLKHFNQISYQPNIKTEDLKGRINTVSNFTIINIKKEYELQKY